MNKAFPKDWFDIPPEKYADFGALFYLASLTTPHRDRSLAQVLYAFETPFRLGQYHIFRQNGFPRGFVTFAGLNPETEHRYAIQETPLTEADFTSGPSFWIIDLVAPFGQTNQIVEMLKKNIPHPRVRTNRMDSDMSRNRIVEWTRDDTGEVHMQLYRKQEFERVLAVEGT
ncbi:Hemolysin-activating lysine-acyltransferase HlyC [Ruegeria denitrificans]|uniref:RTX toxin-activating lysine-acyltransferase n=1 Tax=Ruegeria denitrificans TaxID=1715692 RepID=A0A0P1IJV7_9RHOB|nr:toxin-activating lysine-acyltransferase [Ruegeria denitrificans]CUK02251.1 Hemolysin-activating lysine-acyltransferase HlyC [Ruegeria denitrificans]